MWIDRAVKWLLPKEQHFYDLLEKGGSCVTRCGEKFFEFCESETLDGRLAAIEMIRIIEREADEVKAEIFDALNKTFVTPLDRGDIYHLASRLENVTDNICDTALQVVVHAMEDFPKGSLAFAELIRRSTFELSQALPLLRELKSPEQIRKYCKNVSTFDEQGSELFRQHTAEMFRRESNAIVLLKHKEFLEGLDSALESCKQVAQALENIVIKNA